MKYKRSMLTVARRASGLTALALADQIDVSEQKIYAVERGRYRPTIGEAERWAKALGLRPNVLWPDLFPDLNEGAAR